MTETELRLKGVYSSLFGGKLKAAMESFSPDAVYERPSTHRKWHGRRAIQKEIKSWATCIKGIELKYISVRAEPEMNTVVEDAASCYKVDCDVVGLYVRTAPWVGVIASNPPARVRIGFLDYVWLDEKGQIIHVASSAPGVAIGKEFS